VYFIVLIIHNNINLQYWFALMLVYNKHLLINMDDMNIKIWNFNFCYNRPGLTNLRRARSKWQEESLSWHAALNALPFCLFLCPTRVSILRRTCIYKHTSDYVESVYELPLISNNTASQACLHKLGAVRNVDRIFIKGRRPGGNLQFSF
jgi:hypothetical protein